VKFDDRDGDQEQNSNFSPSFEAYQEYKRWQDGRCKTSRRARSDDQDDQDCGKKFQYGSEKRRCVNMFG